MSKAALQKGKVIPNVKVSQIPYFERNISHSEKEKYGMIMSNGRDNYYRIMFAKGQGGSQREETWDRTGHNHTCCGSKVSWRHKTVCPKLNF